MITCNCLSVVMELEVDFIFGYDLLQAYNCKINAGKNHFILESSLGLIHVNFLKQSELENWLAS